MQETWETWVSSLGQEDILEKGNGSPLQYSCLGNPMDRGAWQATVHEVTKSQTWLGNTQQACTGERGVDKALYVVALSVP